MPTPSADTVTSAESMVRGERRWPMALAVITVGVLQQLLPEDFRTAPFLFYLYPIVLTGFLIVLDDR